MRIRPATDSDLDAAYRLMAELGYPNLSRARFFETYRSVLEHAAMRVRLLGRRHFWLLSLASMSTRPQLRLTSTLVTIDEFVIAGGDRGKGIGRELLNAAKEIASEIGARRLELETNRARESYQRAFYIKKGLRKRIRR